MEEAHVNGERTHIMNGPEQPIGQRSSIWALLEIYYVDLSPGKIFCFLQVASPTSLSLGSRAVPQKNLLGSSNGRFRLQKPPNPVMFMVLVAREVQNIARN